MFICTLVNSEAQALIIGPVGTDVEITIMKAATSLTQSAVMKRRGARNTEAIWYYINIMKIRFWILTISMIFIYIICHLPVLSSRGRHHARTGLRSQTIRSLRTKYTWTPPRYSLRMATKAPPSHRETLLQLQRASQRPRTCSRRQMSVG